MPTNVVKTPEDEEKWKKAKAIASKEGQSGNYAYIMGIYKKMKGSSEVTESFLHLFERKLDE